MNSEINASENKQNGLNENHIRAISITLSELEKNIDEIEGFIKDMHRGRMYEIKNDLTDLQKEIFLEQIQQLRESICQFADEFGLVAESESLSYLIRGTFSIEWVNVCEMEPKRLSGYGDVGKDIWNSLDNYIKKLEKLINNIK
nr:hypothetical protein [uncultured Caproiciproducens sp.]